jgi:hypothetical protein
VVYVVDKEGETEDVGEEDEFLFGFTSHQHQAVFSLLNRSILTERKGERRQRREEKKEGGKERNVRVGPPC